MNTPSLIPPLEKLASTATADITRLLREAYEIGREDMRKELLSLLHPSPRQAVTDMRLTVAPAKAPPGTVRPAILNMIEQSSGVSTEQIMTATGFKENSVRGTLSTLHKERKIARNADGQWIAPIKTAADQMMEEAS